MKKEQKNKFTNINTYLIIALVLVIAIGLYFTLSVPTIKKTEQPAIPARQITLTVLGTDCQDCFNASIAVDFLKQQATLNVTETKELTIEESQELTQTYNITRLPAVIMQGETENLTVPNFETRQDALVFDQTPPPYYDVQQKRTKGKVTLVHLKDEKCINCFDMSLIIDQLEQAGVKITSKQTVHTSSEEGKALISQYKIDKVPTLLFNKEALEYEIIQQVWSQVGTEEIDGKLVLRFVNPPYVNTSTGKTEGLVGLTYIVDETCTECFNASVYGEIFTQSFNMQFATEETAEASSTKGKFLIKKYNITSLPTAVLSKEANAYGSLAESWTQVGTIEKDGAFVFRQVELLKNYFDQTGGSFAYKDLATGEIKTGPAVEEQAEITEPEAE